MSGLIIPKTGATHHADAPTASGNHKTAALDSKVSPAQTKTAVMPNGKSVTVVPGSASGSSVAAAILSKPPGAIVPSSSSSAPSISVTTAQQQQAVRMQKLRENIERNANLVKEAVGRVIEVNSDYCKEYAKQHKKNADGAHTFSINPFGICGIQATRLVEEAIKMAAVPQSTLAKSDANIVLTATVIKIRAMTVISLYLAEIAKATKQSGDALAQSPIILAHVYDINTKYPLR